MKIAVLIDGDTTKAAVNPLAWKVDYARVQQLYGPSRAGGDIVTTDYFATEGFNNLGNSHLRVLLDWLELNGYRLHSFEYEIDDPVGLQPARNMLVVQLAIEVIAAAQRGAQMVVIWSNDAALVPAVQAAQRAGAFVRVVSTLESCSKTLRRAADGFEDLTTMRGQLAVTGKEKAA